MESPNPPRTFPPPVYALLDPPSYLQTHLLQTPPSRPSSRSPSTFPTPTLHASPLTYTNGSCVARAGDTAVVAGIRAEILDAKDIPDPPNEDDDDGEKIRKLGLVVANVEIATGAGKKWLPGGAPGTFAQGAAFKVQEMLVSFGLLDLRQLEIRGTRGIPDDSEDKVEEEQEVLAYWTLYIDITLISHVTAPLSTIWAAALGALLTTRLPQAYYSAAHDLILCSSSKDPVPLSVRGRPILSTFAVFTPAANKGLKAKEGSEKNWVLAEPDEFEEGLCEEVLEVVVDCSDVKRGTRIRRVEKTGGRYVDQAVLKDIINLAVVRWGEWNGVLEEIGDEDL